MESLRAFNLKEEAKEALGSIHKPPTGEDKDDEEEEKGTIFEDLMCGFEFSTGTASK